MLINNEENIIDQSFINDLKKKFSNFCKKSPIPLSFKITEFSIYVHEYEKNEVKGFDFSKSSVKQVIKEIKDWLCEHKYPIMVQTTIIEKDYSPAEYVDMVNTGQIKYEQIPITKRIKEESIRWRIERLIINKDELLIRNLEEDKIYRFKLKMPSSTFLKKIREDKLDSFQAWRLFQKRSVNLGECLEVDEENKPIKKYIVKRKENK